MARLAWNRYVLVFHWQKLWQLRIPPTLMGYYLQWKTKSRKVLGTKKQVQSSWAVPCRGNEALCPIIQHIFPSLLGKNLTGLHWALITTWSNTFGMSWKANCQPGLISGWTDQCSCGCNGANPSAQVLKSGGKSSLKSRGCYSSTFMLMILESHVQLSRKTGTFRCPHTGHVGYTALNCTLLLARCYTT